MITNTIHSYMTPFISKPDYHICIKYESSSIQNDIKEH